MKDRIVEEIRARRRALLLERYGGSIQKMLAASREWQMSHPDRVKTLRRRQVARAVA
jgi:hypothetical protein